MIKKKQFGVHTHMWNSTEDPSVIRFGDYNEELFKKGHKQMWMNTTSNMTWEVKFDSAGFHSDMIWNNTHALIDPGYPFIGLPEVYFEQFKQDILTAYPDEPITCHKNDWCYFMNACDIIEKKMPDFRFTFPVNHYFGAVTYRVPPKSFLYHDVDYRTNITMCHVGIV